MALKIPKGKPHWVVHRAGDRRDTYTKAMDSETGALAVVGELRTSSPGLMLEVTRYDKHGKPEDTYDPAT